MLHLSRSVRRRAEAPSSRDRPLGVRQSLHTRRAFVRPPFRAVPLAATAEHRVHGRLLAYGAVEGACHLPAPRVAVHLTSAVRVEATRTKAIAGIGA